LHAEEFEAISAHASADYIRAKTADGSYQDETYAFGNGGYWSGPVNDKTIEKMDFLSIAHIVAAPLANQHYVPAKDPKKTKLLIMVYWGTTYAPEHASETQTYQNESQVAQQLADVESMIKYAGAKSLKPLRDALDDSLTTAVAATQAENRARDNVDRMNASMLGYDSWWNATFDAPNGSPLAIDKADMLNELEEYRYFVVLMAYDFQLLANQKKHKLLWETRFSIRQHVNQFDKQLPAMALQASKYFGKESNGLTHDVLPEGRVEIGPVKDLGPVQD
jgi:hypothetical protein